MSKNATVERHHIEGYEEFSNVVKKFNSNGQPLYVYFTGSKLPTGENWCPNCERAHPVVEDALSSYVKSPAHFIEVVVGDRPYWKDPDCPFRKDESLQLKVLPTLMKWQSHQKLEGEQCEKKDLLELVFTEEE